ncbi:MAG: Beta-hexosaminidase [Myxococcaceae bacterium]|nr:Beta-hexosaminidase [Myxococcaceae bacterium]
MSTAETRVLAGQVLVAGFPGTHAPDELLRACARDELAGVILFKRNLGSMHQIAVLIARIADSASHHTPLLVAVDQEGGRVARLGSPVLKLPPMRALAALGDPALTSRAAKLLGLQLRALGFSMDFAPVLDVDTNPDNPVIGDRSFGTTPEQVIEQAYAFASGLRAAGLLACGKHFPGHGDTDLDSHLALPRLSHDRQRLDRVELPPFREARGRLPALMTAHVVFESLARGIPATLSPEVITGLLRGELGYDGAIISDDLEMKAVADHYGVEQAACLAIEAGCDTLLVCSRLDWTERARVALAERAAREPAFKRRLEEAGERTRVLRAGCTPAPITDEKALERALESEAAEALALEISGRI